MGRKGYIKDLIPGKRYRMVIVAETNSLDPITLPSIEFVVPTAPDLISSYTPIGVRTSYPKFQDYTIPTSPIGATAETFNITHWSSTNNITSYTFWCNGGAYGKVKSGDTIRVRNISDYDDTHQYYDVYDYRVVEKTADYINVVAQPTITFLTGSGTDTTIGSRSVVAADWCEGREGHAAKHQLSASKRPAGFARFHLDGQGLDNRNRKPNSGTGTLYIPRVPANEIPRRRTWEQFDVTVSLPEDFPLFRNIPDGVVDVPVFAYKNLTTRTWHNMDHTPFIPIDNPIGYNNNEMLNLIYDYDGNGRPRRDGVPLNKTSENVNRTTFLDDDTQDGLLRSDNHSKEYYFTIARYRRNASGVWEGGWLQSENSEPRVFEPDAIIWSQKAVGV